MSEHLDIGEILSRAPAETVGQIVRAGAAAQQDIQTAHLQRVSARIARHVLAFCRERLETNEGRFHAEELLGYVTQQMAPLKVASASPDRILRALRQSRELDYRVVSRRSSSYEVLSIGGE